MKIEIRPLNKFEIRSNGRVIGEFEQVSTWEGFVKLEGRQGTIIVLDEKGSIEKIFSANRLFQSDKQPNYKVVKISSSLVSETS